MANGHLRLSATSLYSNLGEITYSCAKRLSQKKSQVPVSIILSGLSADYVKG